jgi:MFS family permease
MDGSQSQGGGRLHHGWLIVLAGALALFSCFGLARFAYGLLLPGMRAGLALGYDQMGFVSTGNFAGYLLSVILAPTVIRLFKPRKTIVFGLALIAVCMLLISRCDSYLALLLLYSIIGAGSGFANIPVMVLVSHWFRRQRRGRAAGSMIMGNGAAMMFSGLLIPRLTGYFPQDGWRYGWVVLGGITLLTVLLTAFLLRNDPQELGLEPIGELEELPPAEIAPREENPVGWIILKLGLIYFIFGATYMIYGTFIVTTMVVEFGFAEVQAGLFWACIGLFSMGSGIGFGMLSDRIGRRRGLMAVYALQTAAYLLAGSGLGTGALLVTVALYGCSVFAVPTIMAAAVGDYLGLSRAATGFSTVTIFFAVGQVVGPASAGILAETSGSFTTSYLAAAGLTALAIVMCRMLPRHSASQ